MKNIINVALILSLVSFNNSLCYAQDDKVQTLSNQNQITETLIPNVTSAPVNAASTPAVQNEIPIFSKAGGITNVRQENGPILTAPVVEAPKRLLKPANRKVDLHAIIFDPNVTVKQPEDAREMTLTERAKYDIDHALHGEISAPSTKGLLEDTMKMTFERGPIESIAPWVDFSSCFQNIWAGDNYKNSLYGLNFQDVGINGKFRTKDDPASGKKTVFRVMFNTGKEIVGNTYLQSFMADNYIMRYWTKDDQILVGYARTAVGLEGGESPYTIPFFARSQISRTYGNVRALGIKAQGNHKLYDYSAGIFSSGRFFKDFFPGEEFILLGSIKPLGLTNGKYGNLVLGGSLDGGNADSRFFIAGTHLTYEYKRLKASFEYASANGSNGSTGFSANNSEGYYGTLAYRITPRLQALIRYDKFDPNKAAANDMRTEYTAGINYFVKGQALKLMLNYVYYTVENGTYGSRIMTGAQIIL